MFVFGNELNFLTFQTPFLKMSILTFRPKLTFWVTNLQIHAVQNVPMDRTDHVGFQQKKPNIWKNVTKKTDFGKWIFEISVKNGKFIGDRCCVFLKSYRLRSTLGLRRLFFWKMTFLDLLDMHIFEKVHFLNILTVFQKWLPRPNRSAHLKGIEILCKTPVSKRPELPPGPNCIGTNSKYSSPARMSTWISRRLTAAAAAAATAATSQELSPSGETPGVPRAGSKYPVRGNPSLRCGVNPYACFSGLEHCRDSTKLKYISGGAPIYFLTSYFSIGRLEK